MYKSTRRCSYIPNTSEGRCLLTRYKYAFEHGHMFFIGYSETKKKDNEVTWSSLPNHTSLKGGPFGFPDMTYIGKAHQALDALGIPSADDIVLTPEEDNRNKLDKSWFVPEPHVALNQLLIPESWKLSGKESKGCSVLNPSTNKLNEIKCLRKLHIPVMAAETVLYIHIISDDKNSNFRSDAQVLYNQATTRTFRTAIVTHGSFQLKRLPLLKSIMSLIRRSKSESIMISIFDVRGIRVEGDVVLLDTKTQKLAFYQTPEPARLLTVLLRMLLAAYVSVPRWAIPMTLEGGEALSAISPRDYREWLGGDGGFSASLYACLVAYRVKHKLDNSKNETVAHVANIIRDQQQNRNEISRIDLARLATDLSSEQGMKDAIAQNGLEALAFNLVFRKFALNHHKVKDPSGKLFQNALSKLLLYNVTLREVDFSHTNLKGLGSAIGQAWAMNAQPLISRLNLSDCTLTSQDLRGLVPGLVRIWCGQTALCESIKFANNQNISTPTWDIFFGVMLHPSTLPFWPQQPPPPPTLAFLQELDLMNTQAVGQGLVRLATKLSGLRILRLSSSTEKGDTAFVAEILEALSVVKAPLEHFDGDKLSDTCTQALFAHSATLKQLSLTNFNGDTAPLLCGWPQAVPKLTLQFQGGLGGARVRTPPDGCSPGSLSISNTDGFGIKVLCTLSVQSTGLKSLKLEGMHYSQIDQAAPILSVCGLESLNVIPPQDSKHYAPNEVFWTTMAFSKTLKDLQLSNQLHGGPEELAMVGRFLKTNRSVQRISFDGPYGFIDVESVKVLRSAFYGNKKVCYLAYLAKARQHYMENVGSETARQLQEVSYCKGKIKSLFKKHYSKHNPWWRDKPNKLKLPYVERIRVAKRAIGKLERDPKKVCKLLAEINDCVVNNKIEQTRKQQDKEAVHLVRRQGQLQNLATKKQKFLTSLVAKLVKAKKRGRSKKSAKTQVPRSTYYKSQYTWPSNKKGTHSYYRYYNDPYCSRFHWQYGYYCDSYHGQRNTFLEDDCDDLNEYSETDNMTPEPDAVDDSVDDSRGVGYAEEAPANDGLDDILSEVKDVSSEPSDPWCTMDHLIQSAESNYDSITSPKFLSQIHNEASELGTDVVSDIAGTLDKGAAVDSQVEKIAESTNISDKSLMTHIDSLETNLNLSDLVMTLDNVPDYDGMDEADADNAVSMYAGAGPRDLDDGGPSFGGFGNGALAGARRRARARKGDKSMRRVRQPLTERLQTGYKQLALRGETSPHTVDSDFAQYSWPDNLEADWVAEVRSQQIRAMAQSELFTLPEASENGTSVLVEWEKKDAHLHQFGIDVILVTQCSLDRLSNLEAQLASWSGRASVAVYLQPGAGRYDSEQAILSTIKNARNFATKKHSEGDRFDVVVTIVEGCTEDEPYPINYLRNCALLEARRHQLRCHMSLENSAVLLVDVDFRASANLYQVMHSHNAAKWILEQQRVIVCPAFESSAAKCSDSLEGLNESIKNGEAEGFHVSQFPPGHSPTCFDKFWRKSMECITSDPEDVWQWSYKIQYEKMFEPYVIMATRDVPLYDERFQGYGLNKVSHLASIAKRTGGEFHVLPGVFLVAPIHERSNSWSKRYGSRSDETKFNQLWLKGLYHNFTTDLCEDRDPVVSKKTRMQQLLLFLEEMSHKQKTVPRHCNQLQVRSHLAPASLSTNCARS